MTWFAVGGAAIGAVGGLIGSSNASKAQQKATDAAIGEQQRQYDTTRNDNATALAARNSALAKMQELAGSFGTGPTQEQVMNSPGYQFGLKQGQDRLNQNAAATGTLYSGAQAKAATQYGTDYATTKYDDALNNMRNSQNDSFNRYASISGQGQLGANAINSAGQNMANNNSAALTNNGNAQGASAISQSNQWSNLGGALGSAAGNWFSQPTSKPSSPGGGMSAVGGINAGMPAYGLAEGGPVRSEPKVGTKAPVRQGGTGGGLSDIMAQIAAQRSPSAPANSGGIGQLPANYLTHPRAIVEAQERNYMHGGAVEGPGGPKDDAIPAHLSNGEHVFDAAAVNAIGGGDNERGQMTLNALRAHLKGMHHAH